jgi:hypothetical protein
VERAVKIGLASDSFGNLQGLQVAFDRFFEADTERIFFLGGRYADVATSLQHKRKPVEVPKRDLADSDIAFLNAVEGALAGQISAEPDPVTQKLSERIVRIASRHCPEYGSKDLPAKVFEMVGTRICCLVHDKADLTRDDIANATILFHGNAAAPGLVQIGPRYFVTPGHLRERHPEGKPPTFAMLDLGPDEMDLVVYSGATGKELGRQHASLRHQSKVSVK